MSKLRLIFLVLPHSSCGTKHWKLRMIIEHAHKKARPVKLTSLANFGRPSGSGTKKGFKRIRNQKNISDQQMHQRFTLQTPLQQ